VLSADDGLVSNLSLVISGWQAPISAVEWAAAGLTYGIGRLIGVTLAG
jgi:hypothetical protein